MQALGDLFKPILVAGGSAAPGTLAALSNPCVENCNALPIIHLVRLCKRQNKSPNMGLALVILCVKILFYDRMTT